MGYRRFVPALLAALGTFAVATSAQAVLPIPSSPGALLVPAFIGAPSAAAPISSFAVPQNPHLAPNGKNNMHDDAYGTNNYAWAGPTGHATKVTSALYGVEECATEAFDRHGQIVALCGQLTGPILRLLNPATLAVRASYRLPGRDLTSGANPLSDLCGGAYFYLDNLDRAVVATTNAQIRVVSDTGGAFTLVRTYNLLPSIPSGDCLIALMPAWDGTIWFLTHGGTIGTVNPVSGAVRTLTMPGEIFANSFSVDETGGVYAVTDHAMYRFDANSTGAPSVTWREAYDRGSTQKPGQLSQGSGTTPTLVGSDLVAITDNADPQMHVVVYDRATGAFVCQQAVFAPGASDTENSLVAVGNSLIVENNYGYQGPQSTLFGKATSPGIAKVDVNAGQCSLAWTNPSIAPTSVAKASLHSGLLYAYTKPASALGIDAWYLTAIDIRTGATAFSRLAGVGPQFNNHYAAIYLGPDGSAYIATLTGMLRFRDAA